MAREPATVYEYDVFISYSHRNKEWVRGELLPRLEAAGLKVCIDFRDFRPGAPSVTEMERAAETSRKTLLILTPEYLASDWTAFENIMLQMLDPVNRTLRVIPVRLSEVELPPRIGAMTYIDFADPDDRAFAWTRLLQALDASTAGASPLRVYLCHAPADQAAVRQLYTRLRNDGFQPWMKEIDVLPGQNSEQEARRTMAGVDAIIVCLSSASSGETDRLGQDIEFALNIADQQAGNTLYRIPLKLEDCDIPQRLQRLQPVRLYEEQGYSKLVAALRRLTTNRHKNQTTQFLTPPNFSWGGGLEASWFVTTETEAMIRDSAGLYKTYSFVDLLGGFKIRVCETCTSPDHSILAICVCTGLSSFSVRVLDPPQNEYATSRLYVFAEGSAEPRFVSPDEWYIHYRVAFSSDTRYIAFAYSHNWRPSTLDLEGDILETVDWEETVAVIDTATWQSREIWTIESRHGYGEWAEPTHFFDLAFVSGNILFAATHTPRGTTAAWNIPLDGGEPTIVNNPMFND